MEFSKAGRKLLELSEGRKSFPYKDTAGLSTIGVGHRIKKGEHFTSLTDQQINDLLAKDIAWAVEAVNRLVEVPLNQNQFDALVCFVFNLGEPNFRGSTLLKKLNAGDYKGAANEFVRWVNAGGVRSNGLVARRDRERALFLKEV